MKNILTKVLLVSGLILCGSASAQYYVGGTVGASKWSVDHEPAATSIKTKSSAYHALAGYSVSTDASIELSYFSLGKSTIADASGVSGNKGIKAKAVAASAVFKTDQWKGLLGFAKLGLAYVKGEPYVTGSQVNTSTSSTSPQLLFGVGATYQLKKNWSIRAEYERIDVEFQKTQTLSSSNSVWNVGLGIQKAF